MKNFRPLFAICAMIGIAPALINCQKPDAPTKTAEVQTTTTSATSDKLTVIAPWELTSLDPAKSGVQFGQLGLAETLVDTDDTGALAPGLAQSWTSNDTFTEWTFVLKDGVQFHDGSPLNADAVIKSLNATLKKPTALEQTHIKDIQKIDDKTLKFILEKPLNVFAAYLAHNTALILAPTAFDDKGEVTALIGTGPYKVTKFEPPQKVEQIAFDGYWGKKASIPNVEYLANSRAETRALLAQSPNHLVYTLDASSTARLNEDPAVTTHSTPIARTIQYKVNGNHPFLGKKEVRQILSRAIDRTGIANTIHKKAIGIAEQVLPPVFDDWQITTQSTSPDYNALKQELMALGYTYDDKGVLLDKGKAVKFTLKTFSDRPELPVIATALQSQFKQLGIDTEVAIGNASDIPASHQDGTLEMGLYARNYGFIPDPSGILAEDFRKEGNDWGVMNYHNDELLKAFDDLAKANDADKKALKQKISQIIYEDKAITPILYYQQNVAHQKNLKGLKLDPFERKFNLNELSY